MKILIEASGLDAMGNDTYKVSIDDQPQPGKRAKSIARVLRHIALSLDADGKVETLRASA